MKHVIIGNGPAGVIAAEALRRLDPDCEIALIGSEAAPPYSRMAIPYFLMGSIPEAGAYLRKGNEHFARNGIRQVAGRVVRVAAASNEVELENGERLRYDRLLIASGSLPLRPPVVGMDLPGVHTCWTLADAREIVAKAKPGTRVLQLGAGFIGCIIMEALAARGVKLTVVEMGDRMVPRMMTERAGAMIRRWVEKKGVAVHVNTRVDAIEAGTGKGLLGKVVGLVTGDGGTSAAMRVKLSSGQTLEADLVMCAAGVTPNVGFLAGSGVKIGRGIRVDAGMQTSVPGVYAAGDVTEAAGFHSGDPQLNAIQPNAADQARVAAANMAGRQAVTQGSLAINVLDTLGLISTSFGQWWGEEKDAGGDGVELADEAGGRYLSLQFKDDILIGATSVGWTERITRRTGR